VCLRVVLLQTSQSLAWLTIVQVELDVQSTLCPSLKLSIDIDSMSLLIPSLEIALDHGNVWVVVGPEPVDYLVSLRQLT